jgi:glycerol kinase
VVLRASWVASVLEGSRTAFMFIIDIGTQSLKAVILGEGLCLLGTGAAFYEPSFPHPLWAEQEPHLWLAALKPAIAGALAAAGIDSADVGALGIAGQLDGCLPVDRKGKPLGSCIIWMDRRASAETKGISLEAVMSTGGVVLDAGHMAAKIRWLKRHHPAAKDIARFHQPTSFVVSRLTGRHVLDHAVASTSMLYNLRDRRLDPALCAQFGIDPAELPEIDQSEAIAGPFEQRRRRADRTPARDPRRRRHGGRFFKSTRGGGRASRPSGGLPGDSRGRWCGPPAGRHRSTGPSRDPWICRRTLLHRKSWLAFGRGARLVHP